MMLNMRRPPKHDCPDVEHPLKPTAAGRKSHPPGNAPPLHNPDLPPRLPPDRQARDLTPALRDAVARTRCTSPVARTCPSAPKLENPKTADQLAHPAARRWDGSCTAIPETHPALQLIAARPDIFCRQGYIAATYRRRNGRTFGPYHFWPTARTAACTPSISGVVVR